MKKTLLLTTALGLLGASSLTAATVDIYITGSTAFRANVFTACTKLFTPNQSTSTAFFANAANGGADTGPYSSKTASWCMTGTPVSTLTNLSGSTLVIHGLFTGSIQGIQTTEQKTKLVWATPTGTPGGLTAAYVTNTPTIGFSDASGASAPYPATGNYVEEKVCVQPFCMVKSTGTNAASTVMAKINNVSWEQLEYGIPNGYIPLSAWTYKFSDTNTPIYIVQRTKDSGTRRCETAGEYYAYNDPVGTYIYDKTNNLWFQPSFNDTSNSLVGSFPWGVVGAAGLGNANLSWGPGYVGGGDIATELGYFQSANTAIAYLSIADAKSVSGSSSSSNWTQVISFNGVWPTAAGAGIAGNNGTNDYTPITSGYYPCWGEEVLVHPVDMTQYSDQDVTSSQLGSQTSPGSFMGVLNAQTIINGGSPVVGSIENEIELSKTLSPGATGIRLSDMHSNRSSVGATIFPY